MAAINAAGEVGPATPDAVSLTLPPPGNSNSKMTMFFLQVFTHFEPFMAVKDIDC